VGVDPGEQLEERVALGGVERGHGVLVDAGEDLVELVEAAAPFRGDGDDVAALVLRVGGALDVAGRFEVVEDGDEVAAVDAGAVGEPGLAGGPELGERGEDDEVVLVRADLGEGRAGGLAELPGGHAREPRELAADPLGGVGAAVAQFGVVGFHGASLAQRR
jgi:hypothetical protein